MFCPTQKISCGETGIRTLGTLVRVRRFSKPLLSATQAPLLILYNELRPKAVANVHFYHTIKQLFILFFLYLNELTSDYPEQTRRSTCLYGSWVGFKTAGAFWGGKILDISFFVLSLGSRLLVPWSD